MSNTTIETILAAFRDAATSNRDLGDKFERLIAHYLLTDPQYADLFGDVWLWPEWPDRWGADVGIDLVARERASGDYWAIQCKFFLDTHYLQKADIDSFFTASGKQFATTDGSGRFARRLLVSTTDKWSKHAEDALAGQVIPTMRLWFKDLAGSPVDWSRFDLDHIQDLRLKPKKTVRPHQVEAIACAIEGFKTSDRGKLIKACGTGKTFTSLRLMEQMVPAGGRVLFLAPSISLISQTLREWTAEALAPLHALVVCSDTKVGKEEEDLRTHDLAYPATTDVRKLANAAREVTPDRRLVVFSTYQSIQVVADAQRLGLGDFDLIVCDEAHRTTGLTLRDEDPSEFVKVHHQHLIRGHKRLYMTATPRIYADASKTKAGEKEAVLFSMDDLETYGPEFYRLGFGKAVELDLLSEYKVLIVAVEESRMAALANAYNSAYKIVDKKAINIHFATKIIGSWKGLSKQGLVLVDEDGQREAATEDPAAMRRAVAFSRTIKDSKLTTETFAQLVDIYQGEHVGDETTALVGCQLDHVDGGMNALRRQEALNWLRANPGAGNCRILSNARCLSEGIDVPTLDAVIFFDTRDSVVDIVQSVGRVMRKAEGKQYGYIILPVCIPSDKVKDYNSYIDSDPQFKGIWKVIKALRAHDESLVDEAEFRRKIKVTGDPGGKPKPDGNGDGDRGKNLGLDFPALSVEDVSQAVYAAIPKKLGDREYWSEWAKSIGRVAERLIERITALIDSNPQLAADFDRFLKGLQDTLNPAVSRAEAVEMLAQHILTLPVFQALFAETDFPENNAVGKALQVIVKQLDAAAVASETEGLEKFYANVRERISLAKSDKSKQDIIRNLYDTFFNNAFPRMAERLGIVFTPVPVVDFILKSADAALRKHFGESLASSGVQILDPFAGTGTFLVRLIQSGLIDAGALRHKFAHELHANEIILLAYYIATINIETAYHAATGEYRPFEGMILVDTFQMTEAGDLVDKVILPENNARAERQLQQPIRVIVGNPPYSAGQNSANDNNQNLAYPTLDTRIRETYAARSSATNKNSLYDSYIRAIRWASDRIADKGIVAFVTNGSFLDGNAADGLRQCLTAEFSALYVFNLRGNQRTSGEQSRQEGGKIFGSGSRTPVAITILVKDPAHAGPCQLYYHDIGDSLAREDKLAIIEDFGSIEGIGWQRFTPNAEGDWINVRNPVFETFIELGNKDDKTAITIFSIHSRGVETTRDPWVYNFSKVNVSENTNRMIGFYNKEVSRYQKACQNTPTPSPVEDFVGTDPKEISWSSSLLPNVARGRQASFVHSKIVQAVYRPYCKQWLYFDGMMNHRVGQWPILFPTPEHENIIISIIGVVERKGFSTLVADQLPNLHWLDTGQCFPLYWYEKPSVDQQAPQAVLSFDAGETPDAAGYIRREAITDWALGTFRDRYRDQAIGKEDLFWYVYGILHSPEYKQRFAADLRKMLPRLPFAEDFWAFSQAGRALGQWHLNYETVEPYPLIEVKNALDITPDSFYRVQKMTFGKKDGKPDKSVIVYNANLTLRDIPLASYGYVVNGKSAIDWIMERYAITTDKPSGIRNDPNDWSDDPRYIVDLLKRIVRVSLESVRLVATLPPLNELRATQTTH